MAVSVVSDTRAHLNENIRFAVLIIGRSKARRKVFQEIYRGQKQFKTVAEIARATKLTAMRVLQEGGKLAGNHIVGQFKHQGQTAYRKYATYTHHKNKVLAVLKDPKKASKFPTQQEPRSSGSSSYTITVRAHGRRPRSVTVDDIMSFKAVRRVAKPDPSIKLHQTPERQVKTALKRIIGETHEFTDWGGEKNDLFTNKLRIGASRVAGAFALKGRATQGALTPKKMGANGDQIGRLFSSEADAFFVVYHSKIDESILELLRVYAVAKTLEGHSVTYGIIDGDDLNRLHQAYPRQFQS